MTSVVRIASKGFLFDFGSYCPLKKMQLEGKWWINRHYYLLCDFLKELGIPLDEILDANSVPNLELCPHKIDKLVKCPICMNMHKNLDIMCSLNFLNFTCRTYYLDKYVYNPSCCPNRVMLNHHVNTIITCEFTCHKY